MSTFTNLLGRFRLRRADSAPDDVGKGGSWADAEFVIPNMICEGCAEKIDGALHSLPGVGEVRPNVSQKRIRVRYEPTKVHAEQLRNVMKEAGFPALGA